jgi:K+-sensing histidine kinase KdpD
LIKNAVKCTKEGAIELGYRFRTEKESSELEFYVKDMGFGITKDRQNQYLIVLYKQIFPGI